MEIRGRYGRGSCILFMFEFSGLGGGRRGVGLGVFVFSLVGVVG